MRISRGILNALAAAVLFGSSTPIAKILVEEMPPVLLAGLLYARSGVGLCIGLLLRRLVRSAEAPGGFALPRGEDLKWLAGAVLFGGVLGPVLLMLGLSSTPASASALLLNLEGVFTALLAWFAFRENFDRRIAAGMALIVGGGLLLTLQPAVLSGSIAGALYVAG